ncbi:MAG TPA: peroxiredoxin [Candidatus Dormibacteraeota bacterium]|nr:peroxiredoxin [Candidatus Dormibacteraeota bacterium]
MKVGDRVDDFEATDQHGATRRLSELLDAGPVVLYFYPKAFTPGCTREACHFRDVNAELRAAGGQAVGVSADAVDRQQAFDEKHSLGFPLLSDPERRLARIFGVKRPGPIFNKRATFVIDTDRRILAVISSELNMTVHADRAIEALRARGGEAQLRGAPQPLGETAPAAGKVRVE